MQTDFVVTD